MIFSDSLDAVPLPHEMSVILYLSISFLTSCFDCSTLLCGSVGYITFVSRTFPVASTTASLHPVLNAGSQPSTTLPAIGGCKRSCSRFLPNTLIAPCRICECASYLSFYGRCNKPVICIAYNLFD